MEEKDCPQCGHELDPHKVVATTGDPMDGGVMLCPTLGCQCFNTWSVQGRPKPVITPHDKQEWLLVKSAWDAERGIN